MQASFFLSELGDYFSDCDHSTPLFQCDTPKCIRSGRWKPSHWCKTPITTFKNIKQYPSVDSFIQATIKRKKKEREASLSWQIALSVAWKWSVASLFISVFTQQSSSGSVFSLPIVFIWLLSSQHKISHGDLIFAISEYLHVNESLQIIIYRNEKYFLTLCLHLSTTPYAPTGTERRTHTIIKEIRGDTFHYLNYGAAS